MTDRETPWWAEDDPAGHGIGRDPSGGASSASGTAGGGSAPGDDDRPGWPDLVRLLDVAVRAASQAARRGGAAVSGAAARGPGPWEDVAAEHAHNDADACTVCPVCTLIRTLDGSNPDAVAHLLEAARHATLAVKAVIDAQASRFGGADDFEQIRVEE